MTGFIILYLVVFFAVPARKWQKGYAWRLLRKLPPFSLFKGDGFAKLPRHLALGWGLIPLTSSFSDAIYWIILIGVSLDDYVNGDDEDRKRRWEGAKNKVKWLWTPAMEPARLGGRT